MNYIHLLISSFFLLCCIPSNAEIVDNVFNKDTIIIVYDTIGDPAHLISLKSSDSVYLLFRGDFEDTMFVKFNKVKVGEYSIYKKDYPYPDQSDDADIIIGLLRKPGRNTTIIELKRKKEILRFKMEKGYPICLIEHYNRKWIVKFRRHIVLRDVEIIRM